MTNLPEIREVWNFSDLDATEQAFRELAEQAELAGDNSFKLEAITQLARTFSLRSRFDEAHELLDSIEDEITITPVVEVRYLLERGRTFNSANQQAQALPLFHRAWEISKQHQLDDLTVDAAHMVGIAEPDPETQIEWTEKALAYAEQSTQAHVDKWLGALYNNLGWSYQDNGEYEKALDIFQKSVIWREEKGVSKPLRIAKWTVARALRSLGRYDEALSQQLDLLEDYQSTGDEDGFVYEEIGENLLALNRENEAKPYFADAYRLLQTISWVDKNRLERIQSLSQ